MVRLKQVFLAPGTYRIGGRMVPFTNDDLRTIADNTQSMLAAGIHVPLWDFHTTPGEPSGGPQQFANAPATAAKGWLKAVRQLPDGKLEHELEVLDDAVAKAIEAGRVKFTSPEIGDYIDGTGRDFGTVIRHTALTATPRNPQQGEFERMAVQFSLNDLMQDSVVMVRKPKQFMDEDMEYTEDDMAESPSIETPAENPYIPERKDAMKEEAIIAGLAEKGIILPPDFSLSNENFHDVLLAAINTSNEAENRAKDSEMEYEDDEDPVTEDMPPIGAQFSESETVKQLRKQLADRNRQDVGRKVAQSRIPKPIKERLAKQVATVQFSEDGGERPVFTVSQVVDMISGALPKNLGGGSQVKEADHSDVVHFSEGGNQPRTLEEARKKNEAIRQYIQSQQR